MSKVSKHPGEVKAFHWLPSCSRFHLLWQEAEEIDSEGLVGVEVAVVGANDGRRCRAGRVHLESLGGRLGGGGHLLQKRTVKGRVASKKSLEYVVGGSGLVGRSTSRGCSRADEGSIGRETRSEEWSQQKSLHSMTVESGELIGLTVRIWKIDPSILAARRAYKSCCSTPALRCC